MTPFQAGVLGAVQGITEFLPISSSAHLILVPWFLGWQDPGLAFDVFLHAGTLLALLVYFFREWWAIGQAGIDSILERKIGFDTNRLLFWFLVLGTLPGVMAGLAFQHEAETIFRDPLLICIPLAAVGFLLYWVDGYYLPIRNFSEIGLKDAILIGIAQACAIFPGVSRSGATITAGRMLGFNRESAARFSFLLSLPITLGAVLKSGLGVLKGPMAQTSQLSLAIGFGLSFLFGILAIHVLLQLLRYRSLKWFAWYRIILALIIVLWTAIGSR